MKKALALMPPSVAKGLERNTMEVTRFSLQAVVELRSKAFSEISEHAFAIDAIAAAIADLDSALQICIEERTEDDQQALVTSARHLAQLMDGGQE